MKITIKDKEVEIDEEDYEWISSKKWSVYKRGKRGNCFYFYYTKKFETLYLHRILAKAKRGYVVDHIDHNTLNNKKENLRIGTENQNAHNHKRLSIDNAITVNTRQPKTVYTTKIIFKNKKYKVQSNSYASAVLAYELLEWYFYREYSISNNLSKKYKEILNKIKIENISLFVETLLKIIK